MVTTTYRPSLDPANSELKIRLPPIKEAGSERASSNGDVNVIYPNSIETTGHISNVKGMGVFFGLIFSIPCLMLLWLDIRTLQKETFDSFSVLFSLINLLFLTGCFSFLRADLFAYRDEPVLFNRTTRKVHVFRVRKKMTRPLSPWPLTIDTYDWDCVHGEVGGGLVPGKVALLRYKLYLAITDDPKSNEVIDRFFFGSPRNNPDENTWLWEHIRRYMEEKGPALQPGEQFNAIKGFSHREAWTEYFPWLSPNLQEAKQKDGFWVITIAGLVGFPVMFLLALSTWIARWSSREPQWPGEIVATLGGPALSEQEVLAEIDRLD